MDVFYQSLPQIRDFSALALPSSFTPLPEDWVVCCSDIENSTGLIAEGRYKLVNMIGASVIAAIQNALNGEAFPYVFGGDGTTFAVPAAQAASARQTLARLRHWVAQEFGITLRVAAVPTLAIRAQGLEVSVARFAASSNADYAMFSGGGATWAEAQMKQGELTIPDCGETTAPDLSGLSCRWNNIPARNGLILSLVMVPRSAATDQDFAYVVSRLLAVTEGLKNGGHPVPKSGPGLAALPPGLDFEARLSRGKLPLIFRKLGLFIHTTLARFLFERRRKTAGWDPLHYLETMSGNADYRKFEDGLKMTIDCDLTTRDRIVEVLGEARAQGMIRYGLHAQDEALLTCIVPSASRDDHVHFVDGAAGGYTRAATNMRNMQD